MPVKAPRICGCGHRVASGAACPCEARRAKERKAQHDAKRPNASARGYNREWEKEARDYLARPENQFCRCGAKAVVVMHVKSIRARPDLRMDKSNWRPGCQRCNAIDAAQERRQQKRILTCRL